MNEYLIFGVAVFAAFGAMFLFFLLWRIANALEEMGALLQELVRRTPPRGSDTP